MHRHAEGPRKTVGAAQADEDSDHPADRREGHRLQEKLLEDVPGSGADRQANPDLAGPLRHRDEHDVHDPDPADEQRDRGDAGEERGQHAGDSAHELLDLAEVTDREVVVLALVDPPPLAEELLDLLLGLGDPLLGGRRHHHRPERLRAGDPPAEGRQGHEDDVVLISPEGRRPPLFEHADDLTAEIMDANFGAERVLILEEVATDGLADEAALAPLLVVLDVEEPTGADPPIADRKPVRRDPLEADAAALVAVHRVDGARVGGGDKADRVALVADGLEVGLVEERRAQERPAEGLVSPAPRRDHQQVRSHARDLPGDQLRRAHPQRLHHDDRRDPDHDPERGQERAHLVAPQRRQGEDEGVAGLHGAASSPRV